MGVKTKSGIVIFHKNGFYINAGVHPHLDANGESKYYGTAKSEQTFYDNEHIAKEIADGIVKFNRRVHAESIAYLNTSYCDRYDKYIASHRLILKDDVAFKEKFFADCKEDDKDARRDIRISGIYLDRCNLIIRHETSTIEIIRTRTLTINHVF